MRWRLLVSLVWNGAQKFQARSCIPGSEVPEDVPAVEPANPAQRKYWRGTVLVVGVVGLQ